VDAASFHNLQVPLTQSIVDRVRKLKLVHSGSGKEVCPQPQKVGAKGHKNNNTELAQDQKAKNTENVSPFVQIVDFKICGRE